MTQEHDRDRPHGHDQGHRHGNVDGFLVAVRMAEPR